jgi:hypothetical protein
MKEEGGKGKNETGSSTFTIVLNSFVAWRTFFLNLWEKGLLLSDLFTASGGVCAAISLSRRELRTILLT